MPPKSNKKGSTALLGRAIMRQAAQDKRKKRSDGTGFHVADISSSSNPLQSITDVTSLEDFVSSAVLAEREFIAERGALSFVPDAGIRRPKTNLTQAETESGVLRQLRIPRRPQWSADMTAADVKRREADAFLQWRRGVAIAEMQATGGVTGSGDAAVTPFEKNIEVWRQLWRVVEKSDVLVQIVDGRNPLMFHCPDLDAYVGEISATKKTLLLINKADYLSAQQRYAWAQYLTSMGLDFLFFSAKREAFLMEESDKLNQVAKAQVAAHAVANAENDYIPFDPDRNTTGRVDLAAGLHTHGGAAAGETHEAASVATRASSTAKSSVSSFLDRSLNKKGAVGGLDRSKLAADLLRALVEDDDAETDEEETTGVSDGEGKDHSGGAGEDGLADGGDEAEAEEEDDTTPMASYTKEHVLSLEQERFLKTGDLTGLDPADPLYEKCRVLSRDEFVEHLETKYKDLPRGVKFGAADEAARRKLKELQERRKATMLAAREEEMRRRKLMAARLVEVGLGSQIRFGDAKDIEALELADEEDIAALEAADEDQPLVIGMVGYPNVGKSSTINALMGATANNHHAKRVAVASTPGKTKHFQTLILNDEITLCDCPGLVFPSFISTREEMVVNGVLPIDQLRDHTGPMRLLCQRIPRRVLEEMYGLALPVPPPPQRPDRQPTIYELLETFSRARGFMAAAHAGPDQPRGARLLLKDYCEGRLLYCHPPPGGWTRWCATAEPAKLDASAVEVGSLESMIVAPKPPKSGRITMEDNVLLPHGTHRQKQADGDGAVVAHTSELGQAASAVEGDDDDSEGSLVSDDELDEETLRAFSRKIVVVEEPDEEESEEEQDGETGEGNAAVGEVEAAVGKAPKKTRGLKKQRRLRKGERHEPDPYGTEAAADAAARPFMMAEIAAVSNSGFEYTPVDTIASLRHHAASAPQKAAASSSRSDARNAAVSKVHSRDLQGAGIHNAVPSRLRGQPIPK